MGQVRTKLKDGVSLFINEIPRSQRDKFKGLCALKGMTMTEVVRKFIAEYVRREGGKNGHSSTA